MPYDQSPPRPARPSSLARSARSECRSSPAPAAAPRYRQPSTAKRHGVVYTPPQLAQYVAVALVAQFQPEPGQDTIKVLEPALGEGELAAALLRELLRRYRDKHFVLQAYEIDPKSLELGLTRLQADFPEVEIKGCAADFLGGDATGGAFDLVIANPPYVRTQTLAARAAQQLAQRFGLHGKVDLYYAFLIAALAALKDGGCAAFITSNKFLTISSGRSLRRYLYEHARLLTIADLGDTKVFTKAAVLPCVTVLDKCRPPAEPYQVPFHSVYLSPPTDHALPVAHVCDAVGHTGHFSDPQGSCYQAHSGYVVLSPSTAEAPWVMTCAEAEQWLRQVERNTWQCFGEIAPVRVGIKTCADNVFLFDQDSAQVDLELTKPLITHRNAGCYRPNLTARWCVLYPHYEHNGRAQAYDLTPYPKAQAYLCEHYEQLAGRKYLQAAGRAWYELWVPQKPSLWAQRKIVFRDIAEYPQFWLVTEDAVINGDCYFMALPHEADDDVLYLILAVANSHFIVDFYDRKFNTKLYSSKRRFMKQYVERFPLPDPKRPQCQEIITLVKALLAAPKCRSKHPPEGISEQPLACASEHPAHLMARIDSLVEAVFTS